MKKTQLQSGNVGFGQIIAGDEGVGKRSSAYNRKLSFQTLTLVESFGKWFKAWAYGEKECIE